MSGVSDMLLADDDGGAHRPEVADDVLDRDATGLEIPERGHVLRAEDLHAQAGVCRNVQPAP